MLNEIIVKNFKLFKEETHIPLTNINLLTGINGRGKSTVLQLLLILKQSIDNDRNTNRILFNGDCVSLGNFKDVKNINTTPSEVIALKYRYKNSSISYFLKEDEIDASVGVIDRINIRENSENESEEIKFCLSNNETYFSEKKGPFYLNNLILEEYLTSSSLLEQVKFSHIHYISADRIGPKLFYELKYPKGLISVGAQGENTVNAYYHFKDKQVDPYFLEQVKILFEEEEIGSTIEFQTSYWLDKIFDGSKIDVDKIDDANILTLKVSSDGTFNYFKPTNVGYGYTYVLPIIVAGLIAQKDEILIIENPEAHLHPCAQSCIAKFLALVSLKGVQIIIESHSEHILNGFRTSIYDEVIENTSLKVLYFDRRFETIFREIEVGKDGGISEWPADFFDQATKDLNYLYGF